MEKTKLLAQVGSKEKLKSLSLWKKKPKLTTADIKMETGELCNFVCSARYWCFLLLLSLLSIDVPDLWFRCRASKSLTPQEKGDKGRELNEPLMHSKTGSLPAASDVAEGGLGSLQEGQVLQLVLNSLDKGTGWNPQPKTSAEQHLH